MFVDISIRFYDNDLILWKRNCVLMWAIMENMKRTIFSIDGYANNMKSCGKKFVVLLWIFNVLFSEVFAQSNDSPPSRLIQQPQGGSTQIQGNSKVMLCQANGSPSAVYRWRHNGEYLSANNMSQGSLRLDNLQRADAGEYQCTASNYLGAILSNRVEVQIAYMVPFTNGPLEDQSVELGRARIIELPPLDSYPTPSVQWYNGGTPIQTEAKRYYVTLNQQLVILEAANSDNNKQFHAQATNSYTGRMSDSRTYVLKIQGGISTGDIGPEMIIPPSHTSVIQGSASVVLECVINARPLNYLSIKWFRVLDGSRQLIEESAFKYILSLYQRTLTIKNPLTSDSGTYECEGTFSAPGDSNSPSVTAQANLTVFVSPSFVSQPSSSDTIKELGTTAIIPCYAEGIPTPTVTWYRNAQLIDVDQFPRISLVENRDLQIESLEMTDSAIYQCFATNEADEINAATWLRVVSSAPTIHIAPANQSTIAGGSVRLDCEVSGAPKPTIVWTREFEDGAIEVLSNNERIVINDRELLIQASVREDTALYTCTATNNMGDDSARAYLSVITRTRIVFPPQDNAFIKGSTKELQCGVEHDPSVTVTWTWYHQDVQITEDTRRSINEEGSLEIKSIRNSDIGVYRCEVTSEGGGDTAQADITVIELPYSPVITSVALNTDESRAVDLSWTPGFDGNSPITKFTVEYREAPEGQVLYENDGWILADANIPSSRRSFTIRNLQPAQRYQFRVSAVNDVGKGPGSMASNPVLIPQEAPSGPPQGVVGSPRSESSILLQWQYPSPDHWNGQLRGYSIRYKPANYPDDTLSYETEDNYMVTLYELRGLIVFQEYEIAVAAYNDEGIGVYSNYIRVRTQEGVPDYPPTSIEVEAVNSTSVRIQWNPPDAQFINGINQGYKIEAVQAEDDDSSEIVLVTIPSDTSNLLGRQSTVITGLKKFTDYRLRVLCFTSKGDGPFSSPVSVRTEEDVPEQVGSLRFEDIQDISVRVVWTPPNNVNGILTGYTLRYMLKGAPLTVVTRQLGAEVQSYVIEDLTAQTEYTVEVFASTRAGSGPVRQADISSGIPPVLPEPPRNLAITNIEASSVLLQFIPGFSGYTSISSWIVEAQTSQRVKRQAGEEEGQWSVIFETSDPEASSLIVTNLTPYTRYRLRLIAENIRGVSEASEPTRWFETIQAAPAQPPSDVTMRAVDETSMRVSWTPLPMDLWHGEDEGYRLEFKRDDSTSFNIVHEIVDPHTNSYVLRNLEEYMTYSVRVASFNNVGSSAYSEPVSDITREAVPSAGPQNVQAVAVNSTSIRVEWGEVPYLEQNGQIDGYGVLYKLLGEANATTKEMRVDGATTNMTHITGLKKYREYQIDVRAYTIGPGALSSPPLIVQTHEDVPGKPSSVYFPEVTWTTARIVWSPPTEPNGVITFYSVSYRQLEDSENNIVVDDQIVSSVHEKYFSGLTRDKFYVFAVTARTALGWGEPAELKLRTVVNRRAPDPPTRPSIQQPQIGPRFVTMQWQPGNDNYSPIRNFTIQYQREAEPWVTLHEYVEHDLTIYTIMGLKPNTKYRFRIAATNDVGTSDYSLASDQITTKQAAPESAPVNLTVTPQTRTSVLVTWEPPAQDTWNGDLLGYILEYKELSSDQWTSEPVYNPNLDAMILQTLELFKTYEFKVRAFNMFGESPWSPIIVVFIEIVPTAAPRNVQASATSATEIQLTWQPPPVQEQNGDLLGYKIFYWEHEHRNTTMMTTVVAGSEASAVLSDLRMYTEYSAVLLAFNAAGEGPNATQEATARTLEGIPGPPGALQFSVTSSSSVNVTWALPDHPNGIIIQYRVSYDQPSYVDGERRNVQVDVQANRRYYFATELREDVKYIFRVRARTAIDWGPEVVGNITIGPQPGSPESPERVRVDMRSSSIRLTWTNRNEGDSVIRGYIIQSRKHGDDEWRDLITSNDPEAEVSIPIDNLRTGSRYQFRVIALNGHGPSEPSESTEFFEVEDKSKEKPFYQQWWFLVIVALLGVIFIITVILLLCITGRRSKSKYKDPIDRIPRTTLQLTNHPPEFTPEQDLENDDGLVTIGSRRSQRRSHRKPFSTSARSEVSLPPYSRHPPRPSPGSVNYEDDTETHKSYAESEASDITEKPSEASSSDHDSQHSGSDEEDGGHHHHHHPYGGASGGASGSGSSRPNSFSTSYATNQDVRNSWKRRAHPHHQYANNYTDSEQDSSHYATSLNGAVLMMNNMAGSRAPLPGFSSFV